jgi:O-antigen ligase
VIYVGLLIYCVLLYIRPADWVPWMLNWPLEFVVLGITIGAGVLKWFFSQRGPQDRIPPQVPFLVLWVIAIFLSNAVHGNFIAANDQAVAYTKRALVFVIFWLGINTVRKLRGIYVLLGMLAAVLAWQGIYQVQNKVGWAGQPLYWGGRICWVGLWDGANVLSLMFVMTVPLLLEMFLGPWRLPSKLFALLAGVSTTVGLVLAASRGAWLSLAVVLLVYFRKRMGRFGILIGVLALAAIVAFGPSRLMTQDQRDHSSTRGRVDMWAEGFEMVRYNPVLGVGKGQFIRYTHSLIAHNTFIQNMGETGIVGLFIWLALIYFTFRSLQLVLSQGEKISPELLSATRALHVSFIGYLVASAFIVADFEPLYLLMGLSAIVLRLARQQTELELPLPIDSFNFRRIAAVQVGGMLFFKISTMALSLT